MQPFSMISCLGTCEIDGPGDDRKDSDYMKTAIILAGGKGERLRPLTEDRPKAMVELLGTPIMAYQIHWLASYGFNRVIISCGHRHEIIQSYFGDGGKWNLQITYEIENE